MDLCNVLDWIVFIFKSVVSVLVVTIFLVVSFFVIKDWYKKPHLSTNQDLQKNPKGNGLYSEENLKRNILNEIMDI